MSDDILHFLYWTMFFCYLVVKKVIGCKILLIMPWYWGDRQNHFLKTVNTFCPKVMRLIYKFEIVFKSLAVKFLELKSVCIDFWYPENILYCWILIFRRSAYGVRISWFYVKKDAYLEMAGGVGHFFWSKKVPSKILVLNSDPSNHIISRFYTLWATFLTTKAKKTTYFTTLKSFCPVLHISPYFVWTILKCKFELSILWIKRKAFCGLFTVYTIWSV